MEYVESWKRSRLFKAKKPEKSTRSTQKPTAAHTVKPTPVEPLLVEPSVDCVPSSASSLHAKIDGNGFAQYEVDDYVAVQLEGCKKGKRVFIGQILEIDSNANEFKVAFLERASHLNESLYLWPDKKEISWEPITSIKRKLGQPTVSKRSTNRRVLFSFDED